jgi:hypothetical protein
VIKFRTFVLVSFFFLALLGFQRGAFAQKGNEKKKIKENVDVLLHPKKFYRKYMPGLRIKPNPVDSLYIKSYPNYLSISMRVLSPSIRMDLIPKDADAPGASKFRTNIADIMAFNVGYRSISAGFAFLLGSGVQMNESYAKSQYRTATIKYNGRAWSLRYKYLRFKGLTDVNHEEYIKRHDIVNKEYQFEGVYNPGWRKYSYIAPFTNSQRQLKSRGGFLLKTGVYYTQLSGDSALTTSHQQEFISDLDSVNVIRSLSIKLAPGAGGHFVFHKNYYLSVAVFPSYDLLFYKYLKNPDEKVSGRQTFVFVVDGEASVGYQSERFYAGVRYEVETKRASLYHLQANTLYSYLGLEVGYRFNTPKRLKMFYKATMPPGM